MHKETFPVFEPPKKREAHQELFDYGEIRKKLEETRTIWKNILEALTPATKTERDDPAFAAAMHHAQERLNQLDKDEQEINELQKHYEKTLGPATN